MPALQKKEKNTPRDFFRGQDILHEDYFRAGRQFGDISSIPKKVDGAGIAQNNQPAESPQKQEELLEQDKPVSQKASPGLSKHAPEPIPAAIDIWGESFNEIKTLYEEKLRALRDEVEGPVSKREQFEALFDILKRDGDLGIRYELAEERDTRVPQEVLDTKAGDCNELSLLFAVCAKKLEIGVADVRMLVMDVHFQTGHSHGHATLITSREGRYLIDPAFLDQVNVFHPQDPENVKSTEIRDFYTMTPDQRRIFGVTITENVSTLNEMYAVNLMETVGVYEDRIKEARGSGIGEHRLKAIGFLEKAHEANNKDIFAQRKLIYHYTVLADEAFKAAEGTGNKMQRSRSLAHSGHYCEKAIKLYEKCKFQYADAAEEDDVMEIRKDAYHSHHVLSKIYEVEDREESVLSEFDDMIKILPGRVNAYANKISYLYGLALRENKAGNSSKEEGYLRSARKTGEFALERLKGDYFATRAIRIQLDKIDAQLQRFREVE